SHSLFLLLIRLPPPSTLFPYTTLFRSLLGLFCLGHSFAERDDLPEPIDIRVECVVYVFAGAHAGDLEVVVAAEIVGQHLSSIGEDRKSTRLNSSHVKISYAVFCLKKKK